MATDTHAADTHGHSPGTILYWVIFLALCVFTGVSFFVYEASKQERITDFMAFVIIMAVAVVKATLVAAVFMHLKYDWGRVYFMIVPALILGALLVIVLLPDIVLAWHH